MQHIERLWKTPWSGKELNISSSNLHLQTTKDGQITESSICAVTLKLWGLSLDC